MDESSQRQIERARAGDRSALQSLLADNHGRLRRLATRLLGTRLRTRLAVSDLLQSCYVDVVKGISSLKDTSDEAFEAWTRRVVENGVRRKSRELSAKKRGADQIVDEEVDHTSAEQPSPSGCAMVAESADRLAQAISRLREDRREVLRLRVIEGLSHEDIAIQMGRPLGATRMLLSRARAELTIEIDRLTREANAAALPRAD